jgi:hypothetical protein
LLVEILITASKVNVCQRASIFTLVDLQARKTFRSRTGRKSRFKADFSVLASHKKLLAGRYLPTPVLRDQQSRCPPSLKTETKFPKLLCLLDI